MDKTLSLIVHELKRLKRTFLYYFCFLNRSDKIVLWTSLIMLFSAKPWYGFMGLPFGIIALLSLIQVKKTVQIQVGIDEKKFLRLLPLRLRQIAFNYVLLGFISVICSLGILFYEAWHFEALDLTGADFYLATFSGLIILCCGLERFFDQS